MTKLYIKIILIWGAALTVIVAGTIVYRQAAYDTLASFLLPASQTLFGIISYFLSKCETRSGARLVFLNFALWFGVIGIIRSLYQLAMGLFFGSNLWADFYFYEYYTLLYFLVLSLCVFYVVADHVTTGRSAYTKYFVTLAIVVGVWVAVFYPFLLDAKYLGTVGDFRNLRAIRQSIASLQNEGFSNPSIGQIASRTQLTLSGIVPNDETPEQYEERYIAKMQDFLPEQNKTVLLYKPLWLCCARISLTSVFLLMFCIVHQYFVDSPRGAYLEKIVWCLLPYCVFEALHHFAYTKVTRGDVLDGIVDAGVYLSMGVTWLMLLLAGLRLRFIRSVEGNYYERRLMSDPSRVTRWRDAFDNWVLKQFMNPGELDRRFLTERQEQE